MKFLSLTFILFLTSLASLISLSAFAVDLQSGDVILMSYNCYECRVIESETNSPYSHSGVVLKNEAGQVMVAQSIGFVNTYTLEKFLSRQTPGTRADVFRPQKFLKLNLKSQKKLNAKMLEVFNQTYKGAPFDVLYLWDNFDSEGRELLYCSEFIAKFMDHFLDTPTVPKVISYEKNKDYWSQYFKGNVPVNVLGNSPVSFAQDPRFTFIGSL